MTSNFPNELYVYVLGIVTGVTLAALVIDSTGAVEPVMLAGMIGIFAIVFGRWTLAAVGRVMS